MKKKVIVIISIIVLLVFIPLATVGGIKYKNYIAEIEAVELPEIVFKRSVVKPDKSRICRIIDKEGNVYSYNGFRKMDELIDLYRNEKLSDELELVGKVDVRKVKKEYRLFLELKNSGSYEVIFPESVSDIIESSYSWFGYYYNSDQEIQSMLIFGHHIAEPEVTDERGKELADWITDTVLD